jgi:TolB-like protein/Tfp pilus assembly protein PilF/predicted aspartyl protease
MATEVKKEIELEIAHVLFIDIVAYSRMAIDDQRAAIEELNHVVQSTDEFREAERANRLLKIPTGDGMALVFYRSPEAPVECALEISRALQEHPRLKLRMGVHSGPVSGVVDVSGHLNVAGEGINMAQRVMDCGDAGHILLSKRVAEDLHQVSHWRPHLYDLGECKGKHDVRVSVVNLFTAELGNSERPQSLLKAPEKADTAPPAQTGPKKRHARRLLIGIGIFFVILSLIVLAIVAIIFTPAILRSRQTASPIPVQEQGRRSGASLPIPEKSIAVLPFENFSEDKAFAFFADGVQSEILTDLAKIADLKVISRTSVMQYTNRQPRNLPEIAQALKVAHVLEGSVQRSANRVRVSAQLIDARNDTHVWVEKYDRDLADVFAIQSEIAKKIADQLQAKILPREKLAIEKQPTKDLAAYDLYIRATEAIDVAPSTPSSQNLRENFLQAVSLLEQAIARDPAFFNAYCKLAQAHDQLYLFGEDHTPGRLASAEQAINAALRLQPDAAEARLAQARHLYSKLDYEGARAEIEIARRLLPNDARVFELSGYIDRRQGRWAESARNLERALEVDPNNVSILWQIALSYESLRDYARDAAVLDRIVALKPNDLDVRIIRAQVEITWKADTRPLHELIESLIQQNPASSARLAPIRLQLAMSERDVAAAERALANLGEQTYGQVGAVRFSRAFGEGLLARWKGDAAAAHASFTTARAAQQRIVEAQPDYGPALCVLGLIDAGLGRKDDALREGRRAVELTPRNKDSVNGPTIEGFFSVICAWVGEKDLAIEHLTRVVQLPGRLSYGELQLFPFWDPLRGDPRFERIVASLAPKGTAPQRK